MLSINRHLKYPLPLFLALSLLIHGILLSVLPDHALRFPDSAPQPVEVELARPQTALLEPELAELPPVPPEERTTPAKRLGPQTQVAEQETAPEGRDNLDRPPVAPTPPVTPSRPPVSPPAREPVKPEPATSAPPSEATDAPASARPDRKLSLEDLTRIPDANLKQLTRLPAETVQREQRKQRRDVAPGERVQLDMTEDVLISFYRRFKTHVLGAWNYPAISRQRNEQGRVLTRVTVDREGALVNLQLLDGSGYAALDEAALQALKRSAPYGPLSSHYPKPTHTFEVVFIYQRYTPYR